jgi:flagellar biosynthesis GTPase FlhF
MELEKMLAMGIDEDKAKALLGMHEESITGLKSKNEQLLTEKKGFQQTATEAQQQAEDARNAAVEAQKEKLANEGKFEELKKLQEKEIAEATAKAEEKTKVAEQALNKFHHGNALNAASSLIHDDFKDLSIDKLSNMVNVSYNEQGEASTTYHFNGEVVATTVDELKTWGLTQPWMKRIMNGVDSGGAGASNNSGSAGAHNSSKGFSELSMADKIARLESKQ